MNKVLIKATILRDGEWWAEADEKDSLSEMERSSMHEAVNILFKALGWKSGGLAQAAAKIVANVEELKKVRWHLSQIVSDIPADGNPHMIFLSSKQVESVRAVLARSEG